MPSGSQFRIHVGIVTLLLGGLLIGSGFYLPMTCTSGRGISVSPIGPNESINPDQTVPFVELSTSEQQTFLSALEDEHHLSRISADGPQSQFANVRAVTYKGQDYEISAGHTDCPTPPNWSYVFPGLIFSMVGIGGLQWAGFWRRFWDNSNR
jgi:hypothetical protein